ncbi:MAG TPA: hypothetical protein VMG58_14975 [Candidatus Sulfotelmatobacter sp.]|nr:hypothetical protein [Candidatus Sulfotelmatobacter sp.]
MTDLSTLYDQMVAAATRQGLLIFPGYVGEELPAVWWQGDPQDWPDFLGIAKAEGIRTLFAGRAVLDEEDLHDLAEWVEERAGPGHSNGDRARLKEFERYIGATGEIRLGWVKDGVAYLLQQRTEWYEDFLDLMEEVEGDEEDELDHDHS